MIPGQQLFKAIKSLFDPIQKQGILGQIIPGVGEPRISGTTGLPRGLERVIAGTNIPAPAAFGSRLTARVPDIVEREIRRLRKAGFGISLRVPKVKLRGVDPKAPPPNDIQNFFEQIRGRAITLLIADTINSPNYNKLSDKEKEFLLQTLKRESTIIATQQAQIRFDRTTNGPNEPARTR